MKNRIIAIAIGIFLLLFSSLVADPYFAPTDPIKKTQCMWFDSLNVRFVGNWPFAGSRTVAHDRARDLVFSSSGGGVYIFEVTDPAQPTKLSEKIHTRGFVQGIFYDSLSMRLYVASGIAGLEIWSVSDPASPLKLGFCDTPHYANNVHVSGSYAYVADTDSGLRIIDVSNSSHPVEISSVNFGDEAWGVSVSGSYAYIAAWFSGLFVVDISDPYDPNIVVNLPTTQAINIYVQGDYAYLADWTSFRVFDISDPPNTYEIGYLGQIYAYSIYTCDSIAYLVKPIPGHPFRVIDVSDPANPAVIGECDTPGDDYDVCGTNNTAFVVTYDENGRRGGLVCIDVSNPYNPQFIGQYHSPGHASDIFIKDSYCFVADGTAGLRILDISNPQEPFEIAHWDSGVGVDLFVSDSFAYIVYGNLYIINIATPTNPFKAGSCGIPGLARNIFVKDTFAYVVGGGGTGFRIYKVSNPANPDSIGYLQGHNFVSVYVQDSFAYVTSDTLGLYIIDVSDPWHPQYIGHYGYDHYWADVYVSGSYAYIAARWDGLVILNISNPSNPYIVGSCNTNSAIGVYVSSSYAYIADGWSGLRVIDVSRPSNPIEVGFYHTPERADAVFAVDYLAYVADNNCGIQIYQNLLMGIEENKDTQPTSNPKLTIFPNPFTSVTKLEIRGVSRNPNSNFTIYDSAGRVVQSAELETNTYQLGADLLPGVYFLKATIDEHSVTHKLIKIR